jgi:hypothetical protein
MRHKSLNNSDPWAIGYLRGRSRAYRRGNISLANVAGAIRMARARQVRDSDVAVALAPFALSWDGVELRDICSAVGTSAGPVATDDPRASLGSRAVPGTAAP